MMPFGIILAIVFGVLALLFLCFRFLFRAAPHASLGNFPVGYARGRITGNGEGARSMLAQWFVPHKASYAQTFFDFISFGYTRGLRIPHAEVRAHAVILLRENGIIDFSSKCCGKKKKLTLLSDIIAHVLAWIIWGLRPQRCHRSSVPMDYDSKISIDARTKRESHPYRYHKKSSSKFVGALDSKIGNAKIADQSQPLHGQPLHQNQIDVGVKTSSHSSNESTNGPQAREIDTGRNSETNVSGASVKTGWPIAIVSHGVQGSCSMYVNLGIQLASVGYVVICIEHADGSGLWTLDKNGKEVPYNPPHHMESAPYGRYMEEWRQKSIAAHRTPFLEYRRGEWTNLFDKIGDDDFVNACDHASLDDQRLADLLKCCDRSQVVVAGHSFGATSILELLSSDYVPSPKHPNITGAMLIDLFPRARFAWDKLSMKQDVDVLLLQSEMFTSINMFGRSMLPAIEVIAPKFNQKRFRKTWIRETSHISFSDFGVQTIMREHIRNVDIYLAVVVEFAQFIANGGSPGPLSQQDAERFHDTVVSEFPDHSAETKYERVGRLRREAKSKQLAEESRDGNNDKVRDEAKS